MVSSTGPCCFSPTALHPTEILHPEEGNRAPQLNLGVPLSTLHRGPGGHTDAVTATVLNPRNAMFYFIRLYFILYAGYFSFLRVIYQSNWTVVIMHFFYKYQYFLSLTLLFYLFYLDKNKNINERKKEE